MNPFFSLLSSSQRTKRVLRVQERKWFTCRWSSCWCRESSSSSLRVSSCYLFMQCHFRSNIQMHSNHERVSLCHEKTKDSLILCKSFARMPWSLYPWYSVFVVGVNQSCIASPRDLFPRYLPKISSHAIMPASLFPSPPSQDVVFIVLSRLFLFSISLCVYVVLQIAHFPSSLFCVSFLRNWRELSWCSFPRRRDEATERSRFAL